MTNDGSRVASRTLITEPPCREALAWPIALSRPQAQVVDHRTKPMLLQETAGMTVSACGVKCPGKAKRVITCFVERRLVDFGRLRAAVRMKESSPWAGKAYQRACRRARRRIARKRQRSAGGEESERSSAKLGAPSAGRPLVANHVHAYAYDSRQDQREDLPRARARRLAMPRQEADRLRGLQDRPQTPPGLWIA